MILTVNTTRKKFYRQILEILSSIPPLDKLRKRELDLLSMLMYYNYIHRNIEETIRWRIINDTSTRREIQEELGMNEDIFNNNLSLIRKTGLIDKDGKIAQFLQITSAENKFSVTFNFNFDE